MHLGHRLISYCKNVLHRYTWGLTGVNLSVFGVANMLALQWASSFSGVCQGLEVGFMYERMDGRSVIEVSFLTINTCTTCVRCHDAGFSSHNSRQLGRTERLMLYADNGFRDNRCVHTFILQASVDWVHLSKLSKTWNWREGDGKQLSGGCFVVFFGGVRVSKTTVASYRPCHQ